MIDDTWDSKNESKDIVDVESSQLDKQIPEVTDSETKGSRLTSRRELWSFYLYYIVRVVFSACPFFVSSVHQGKQWSLWLQLWSIPVPKLALPCGL